jgi:serine protease inhibitor
MKTFVLLMLSGVVVTACSDHPVVPENKPNLRALSAEEAKVANSSNDFAFNLFRRVQKENTNTFISPLSVGMALGMTLNGASEETRQSILSTIDFNELTATQVNTAYRDLTRLLLSMDKKTQLGIANSVWHHKLYSVNPTFSATIKEFYDGTVQSLDFTNPAAKETINGWVEDKTNSRIKNLIEAISPDEIMFLVNAIYFKSNWVNQFDKSKTHKAPFIKENNEVTQVDMMFSKGVNLLYYANGEARLLDIPYGNGQFTMTIIMPLASSLSQFSSTLSNQKLSGWYALADTFTTELEIPKFKMTWKDDLKESLQAMGMLMDGFPYLFEDPLPLAISQVVHQSFIEVNEEGSEAAAATAVGVVQTSAPSHPPRITIDRPFIFCIREKHTNTILFMGQLVDPDKL